jgi:hypothetical protein
VREARILPDAPATGDTLSIGVKSIDPDGDPLELRVEWFHNGQPVQDGAQTTLTTTGYARGDQVYAIVHASDGTVEVSERAAPIQIVNQLPRITRLTILPEVPSAGQDLTVLAEGGDGDRDSFEFTYQWFVNGSTLPEATEATLKADQFKRGDELQVAVTASDPYGEGDVVRSSRLKVPNAAPTITSDPSQATVGSGLYRYVVKAKDPDGDRPLRYLLVDGPDGMQIDLLSGAVTWRVPSKAGGAYPVVVGVSDPMGGEVRHQFTVDVRWETPPASGEEE